MKFIITLVTLALFLAAVAGRETPASAPAPVAGHVPWNWYFPTLLIDDAPPGPAPHSK